eukprot:78394_1
MSSQRKRKLTDKDEPPSKRLKLDQKNEDDDEYVSNDNNNNHIEKNKSKKKKKHHKKKRKREKTKKHKNNMKYYDYDNSSSQSDSDGNCGYIEKYYDSNYCYMNEEIDDELMYSMPVKKLKKNLKYRGLPINGKKSELQKR